MTDPLEEQLRRAMRSGGERFTSARAAGESRNTILLRVHRRQRQVIGLAVVGLLVVSGSAVALAGAASESSPSRQVAARGASGGAVTTAGTQGGGTGTPVSGSVAGSIAPGPTLTTGGGSTTTHRPTPSTTTLVTASATTIATPPATTAAVAGASMVRGTVRFSPVCPVESNPPNPACAPRPGAAHIRLLRADGTVVTQGDAGTNGDFAIPVAPGNYTVEATVPAPAAAIGRGCTATPATVTVPARAAADVAVACDTGIR